MAALASQPIAFASSSRREPETHYPTQSPTGFYGSPMSFKFQMGSFGNRFYPGYSPGTFVGPFDSEPYRAKLQQSFENYQIEQRVRAVSGVPGERHDEMARNYSCCGRTLSDLHALVEHFEVAHVQVLESPSLPPVRANSAPDAHGFDPDDMELDSSPSTGPSTPISEIPCAFENTTVRSPTTFATSSASQQRSACAPRPLPQEALNPYTQYAAQFSSLLPGTVAPPTSPADGNIHRPLSFGCVPPALLFSGSGLVASGFVAPHNTPECTPDSSRVSSPVPPGSESSQSRDGTPKPSMTLSRPASTLLLSKPFRCPKEGCNKSYKQANGLKYHVTHGQCTYSPRDPSTDGLSEHELEEKLRPYQCQVSPCGRRYKNMNGLRYHYQHSGDHGAIGLAMLAAGQSQEPLIGDLQRPKE